MFVISIKFSMESSSGLLESKTWLIFLSPNKDLSEFLAIKENLNLQNLDVKKDRQFLIKWR